MRLLKPVHSKILASLAVSSLAVSILALSAASAGAKITHAKPVAPKQASRAQGQVQKAPEAAANQGTGNGRNADGSLHMPTLADAPKGDFALVAWCHGVLSGDMELADLINPVLPTDDQLQLIGESYLRAYEAALTLSGKGKSTAEHKVAEDARQFGYNQWAAARKAPLKEAAGLYINWQLPGECEKAAVRLSGHPNLFAEMATDEEADAIEKVMNSGGPHDLDEKPKPVLTASAAPADPNAPLSANTLGRQVDLADALPKMTPAPAASSSSSSSAAPRDDKRKWSEGLAYRLGWTDKPGK
ncbi:hypothetical protein [Asticcacaulis sp. EMRT-3]|uniref:hypothetical protein n=1 Tax=Asticcacaulis sp. EMRT-3 TaxID=3040349 RepID=UPI0024AFFA52|nr:hypothetical protein [Asticcacaulis sp. EMRT-3]MDI7773762.1 hypothetical protein [Asticcacaulis sp. EMRT-3]